MILQGSVPIPAEHVLAPLQEHFHEQFVHYGIIVQHEAETTKIYFHSKHARDGSGPAKDVQPQ
jgi:hypothetical protein